jgi:hypothetical protein
VRSLDGAQPYTARRNKAEGKTPLAVPLWHPTRTTAQSASPPETPGLPRQPFIFEEISHLEPSAPPPSTSLGPLHLLFEGQALSLASLATPKEVTTCLALSRVTLPTGVGLLLLYALQVGAAWRLLSGDDSDARLYECWHMT